MGSARPTATVASSVLLCPANLTHHSPFAGLIMGGKGTRQDGPRAATFVQGGSVGHGCTGPAKATKEAHFVDYEAGIKVTKL